MALIKPDGTRLEAAFTDLQTPYWRRVLQMARGRYHRDQDHFSKTARTNAKDTRAIAEAIAEANTFHLDGRALMKDDAFTGAVSKFQHYVRDEPANAFAAANCLRKAENRAAFLAGRWY